MNLFPKIKTPYFIYSPSYTHTSSGVMTLHLLCHALNESGQKAYLYPDQKIYAVNPHLNTPTVHDFPQFQNFYQHSNINPIVVYPDIVRGNPLNAKHVVRYLLAPRGDHGGDCDFPDTDQVWGALPSIADNVLRLPVCDTDIFYPLIKKNSDWEIISKDEVILPKRSGSCFYSHKYEIFGNTLLEMPVDCESVSGTPQQVADILRRKEICYLYEVSSIITEAALCGCPVELMRTPYFNKIDPQCMMGNVKWSDGEIVKLCDDFLPEYKMIVDDFPSQLQNFINKTQGMA